MALNFLYINLLSAIPFEIEGSLRDSIIRLGKSFGLNKKIATELLQQCAESTDNFQEQVLSETNVPHETQKRLISVISDVRKKLGVAG